jgi:excisionase family DNA binding protein
MSQREDPDGPMRKVTDAAARLARAEESQREASAQLARAMYDAHKSGHTWSEIASGAGLASPHTARTRTRQLVDPSELTPSERWRQERGLAPRPKVNPPGVSVSEAAKQLGITRNTVYAWIKSGKLKAAEDEAGRPRVLLADD